MICEIWFTCSPALTKHSTAIKKTWYLSFDFASVEHTNILLADADFRHSELFVLKVLIQTKTIDFRWSWLFWLPIPAWQTTLALSDTKQQSFYPAHGFAGQEFKQGRAGVADLRSTMTGAPGGLSWVGWRGWGIGVSCWLGSLP